MIKMNQSFQNKIKKLTLQMQQLDHLYQISIVLEKLISTLAVGQETKFKLIRIQKRFISQER